MSSDINNLSLCVFSSVINKIQKPNYNTFGCFWANCLSRSSNCRQCYNVVCWWDKEWATFFISVQKTLRHDNCLSLQNCFKTAMCSFNFARSRIIWGTLQPWGWAHKQPPEAIVLYVSCVVFAEDRKEPGSKEGRHTNTKQLCAFQRNPAGSNRPYLKSSKWGLIMK